MTTSITAMKNRWLKLGTVVGDLALQAIVEERSFLLNLNQEQLYDGKNREGNDIHPTYYEDPYFDTLEEAIGYSNWKDLITPNPRRTKGVPNLFINGHFYSTMRISVTKQSIVFKSKFDDEAGIFIKYTEKIVGLNKQYRIIFIGVVNPIFRDKIKALTGCK